MCTMASYRNLFEGRIREDCERANYHLNLGSLRFLLVASGACT